MSSLNNAIQLVVNGSEACQKIKYLSIKNIVEIMFLPFPT